MVGGGEDVDLDGEFDDRGDTSAGEEIVSSEGMTSALGHVQSPQAQNSDERDPGSDVKLETPDDWNGKDDKKDVGDDVDS